MTKSTLNGIASYVMCPGLPEASDGGEVKRHTIPCETDKEQSANPTKELCRHKNCVILMSSGDSVTCRKCTKFLQKRENQRLQKLKPVHPFAPLSQVSKVRLVETVKHLTSENKELNKELKLRVQREVSENSIEINPELVGDIETIMSKNTENITPFMQLFWQQQKESSITKGYDKRYHPMIIKFCLCMIIKMPSNLMQALTQMSLRN